MNRPAALQELAAYLSGPEVVHNSVLLSTDAGREHAERYFALRAAFGVVGYDTKKQALIAICRTLSKETE